MKIAESELVINSDGSAFHIHIKPEQLADIVILVGDRNRVEMFKPMFTNIECENSNREFNSFTGLYKGKRMTVLSTGIGIGNIDIVMNELDALANIDFNTREIKPEHRTLTILRIGTCGGLQPDMPIGTFAFSEYSAGIDGLLNWYVGLDTLGETNMAEAFAEHVGITPKVVAPYIVKDSEILTKLFADCTVQGITISSSGFYGPQGRVLRMQVSVPGLVDKIETFRYEGHRTINFEMEGSAIAGIAKILGHEAATVCCVIANRHLKSMNTDYKPMVEKLITTSLDKLSTL